jgi:hypothetical protein
MRQELESTPVHFTSCECVEYAGVLLLLPLLISAGLLSYKSHYKELKPGYYFIDFIILFLAFLYLCRIKNIEQTKGISPGEFGKLLGVDRIPECRCMRYKLKEIIDQKQSDSWNSELSDNWSGIENNMFYYIDGHIDAYTGYKATLGKKHIARQKLCLPGVQEFWVNNMEGLPFFYVTGQVNEKLLETISTQIVPKILTEIEPKYSQTELENDPDLPRFTILFDREGYSPAYFNKLWNEHRVGVITYRKNVKDEWPEKDFSAIMIENGIIKTEMKLAEKEVILNKVTLREIRKLSNDGHQTSIITTNKKLDMQEVAKFMFSRWTQENFFKYMQSDYDFDRLMQYVVEQADSTFIVANPEYNNLNYHLKKIREKINRKRAVLHKLMEENVKSDIENTASQLKKQAQEKEALDALLVQEEKLISDRKKIPSRIKIGDMPEHLRYNRLHSESKHFQNIIKMICYRAETNCANLFENIYNRSKDEKRVLVKSIINSHGDIISDYENKTLTISIYSQSNPRMNAALSELCEILNEAEYCYPSTDLRLIYKIAK